MQSKPKLRIFIERNVALQQGWGQFIQPLGERFQIRRLGAKPGTRLARYWPRVERLLLRHYIPCCRSGITYFAWGDAMVQRFEPNRRCFATIHQPPSKWPAELGAWAEAMGGIHLLSHEDAAELRKRAPKANIRVILHGIWTDFWKPAEQAVAGAAPKLIFTGQYMRNFEMFFRVAEALRTRVPALQVEMLLNPHIPLDYPLPAWVRRVGPFDAYQLREFYQSATLMWMPYNEVTASNSITESLSSGVPVVTTRVGGMPSYAAGGGMVLVQNNDDAAALEACARLLESPTEQAKLAEAARVNACNNLDWSLFVRQMGDFFAASL